jgi:hypothetical protein
MRVAALVKDTGLERSAISKALNEGARSDPLVFVEVGRVGNAKRWKLANV